MTVLRIAGLRKTAALETIRTVAFFPLTKYNAKTGEFSGVLASEAPDRAGEIMDYEKSKPFFKNWIEASKKASGGKSLGPVREMHQSNVAAGKLTSVTFDDQNKRVIVKGKIVDPVARQKAEEGVYTGLSVGGDYVGEPWQDPSDARKSRYIAGPTEASLADIPCNPEATFELVGADGLTKTTKKFAPPEPEIIAALEDEPDSSLTARAFAAVGGGPRPSLRKTLARSPMAENEITTAELRKAMKKAAKHAAKKQVKKAIAGLTAADSPLMKQLAGLSTKAEVEAGLKKAVGQAVTAIVAAITADGDDEKSLTKAANAIHLVPDDEGKTGEDQSPEAKALRKTIADAQESLKKIAGDKGNGGGASRPLAFAADL